MLRNIGLDALKVTLAIMVVGLHTSFLHDVSRLGEYLTVNGLFRIAVPIFLLINGFYFHAALLNGKSAQWLRRVTYLYGFWMMFYSYFWFRPAGFSLPEVSALIPTLLFGYFHLWYLPGMLGAALLVLVLNSARPALIVLSIFVTFVSGVTIQYTGNYHLFNGTPADDLFNSTSSYRNFLLFAFPFFGLGFLISKLNIHETVSLKYAVLLVAVGLALLTSESYANHLHTVNDDGFAILASLIVVCPALFLLFVKLDIRGTSKSLSTYATGIYFTHIFFCCSSKGKRRSTEPR